MEKIRGQFVSVRFAMARPLSMHWWRAENQPLRIANCRRAGSRSAEWSTIARLERSYWTDMAKLYFFLAAARTDDPRLGRPKSPLGVRVPGIWVVAAPGHDCRAGAGQDSHPCLVYGIASVHGGGRPWTYRYFSVFALIRGLE